MSCFAIWRDLTVFQAFGGASLLIWDLVSIRFRTTVLRAMCSLRHGHNRKSRKGAVAMGFLWCNTSKGNNPWRSSKIFSLWQAGITQRVLCRTSDICRSSDTLRMDKAESMLLMEAIMIKPQLRFGWAFFFCFFFFWERCTQISGGLEERQREDLARYIRVIGIWQDWSHKANSSDVVRLGEGRRFEWNQTTYREDELNRSLVRLRSLFKNFVDRKTEIM